MGYKASPTCELTFGAHGVPARGWLVGDTHEGIAQMFKVIENARMLVGIKSSGTLVDGLPQRAGVCQDPHPRRRHDADDGQERSSGADHPAPRRAPLAHHAEGLRRGATRDLPLHRGPSGCCCRRGGFGRRCRVGEPGQRPAAADHQGRGLRAGVPVPDRVAANSGRFGVPAGLPDRAVHPRREDRLALRGHHRDPGAGLLLPKDRPRQRRGAGACGNSDPFLHRQRRGRSTTQGGARLPGHRTRGRAGDDGDPDRVPDGSRPKPPATCTRSASARSATCLPSAIC